MPDHGRADVNHRIFKKLLCSFVNHKKFSKKCFVLFLEEKEPKRLSEFFSDLF